jgi:hypothetical protein
LQQARQQRQQQVALLIWENEQGKQQTLQDAALTAAAVALGFCAHVSC